MKTFKTIMAAAILSLALSIHAPGGDMSTPGAPISQPPPPATCSTCDPLTSTETSTKPDDTGSSDGDSASPGDIELQEFAVNMLLVLLLAF
jgi:hypothetical protein